MKNRCHRTTLSLITLFLLTGMIGGQAARAQGKTLLYQGSWRGIPCSVTVNWSNFGGIGPVTGQIFIDGDKTYQFTGNNPVQERLEISVPGDPMYQFDRSISGAQTTWSLVPGGEVTFSRTDGGSGLPGSGLPGSGLPGGGLPGGGGKPDPNTTVSTGAWGGSPMSITINWDNYKGQGPVAGQIQYNGATYNFSGSNPSKGYLEINVVGVSGTYLLNKTGTGSSAVWSGSLNGTHMSFSTSGVAVPGGGGINVPGGTTWLIACEAERNQALAEKHAVTWRARGFSGASVIHKSQYNSLNGDQNWWITCAGTGNYSAMKNLLPQVKGYYSSAYGIKADQSTKRETFE